MKSVDLFGDEVLPVAHKSTLGENWDYPPFSVLNAREGWWQERKRAWLSLGIKSELGRGGDLIPNGGGQSSKERYDRGGVPRQQPLTSGTDLQPGRRIGGNG